MLDFNLQHCVGNECRFWRSGGSDDRFFRLGAVAVLLTYCLVRDFERCWLQCRRLCFEPAVPAPSTASVLNGSGVRRVEACILQIANPARMTAIRPGTRNGFERLDGPAGGAGCALASEAGTGCGNVFVPCDACVNKPAAVLAGPECRRPSPCRIDNAASDLSPSPAKQSCRVRGENFDSNADTGTGS